MQQHNVVNMGLMTTVTAHTAAGTWRQTVLWVMLQAYGAQLQQPSQTLKSAMNCSGSSADSKPASSPPASAAAVQESI
jgi:hypothetical protein